MLVSVGQQVGLRHAGLKALASLRMEKGYRDFGHDMDNTDSLLEVGLGFTADFNKPGGFVGMEAVLKQKEAGLGNLPQRLLQILVKDPQPMMFHGEIVYQDGVSNTMLFSICQFTKYHRWSSVIFARRPTVTLSGGLSGSLW
jgi:4-methylaminobutanoate oxidase (formaldehyde-forming)